MPFIPLQTTFLNRDTLADYVREQFPKAAQRSPEISTTHGGRAAAEVLVQQIRPDRYAASRNSLTGAVTRLSPYLRHGIVTLAEVRRRVLENTPPQKAYKFLQELAWRDYYQRVYERLGNDVWRDIEPYKTGVKRYAQDLPEDISQGTTGAACMDAFATDLRETGYLHNHARMWTAAYIVHHRRIRWQAGARWFLQHLLDGDPASNNLSWQWVASTFAAKPYFFNRENLSHYTDNKYCATCPLARNGCPFEGTYEDVSDRIFPGAASQVEPAAPEQTSLTKRLSSGRDDIETLYESSPHVEANSYLIWVNEESLDPHNPALTAYAQHSHAMPVFVFDAPALDASGWSLKRIAFLYESLLEIPNIHIYHGSSLDILTKLLADQRQQHGSVTLATTPVVDPRLQQLVFSLEKLVPVEQHSIEQFAPVERIRDLRRFSRYWGDVEHTVINKYL